MCTGSRANEVTAANYIGLILENNVKTTIGDIYYID
jgi:hypothetical protein